MNGEVSFTVSEVPDDPARYVAGLRPTNCQGYASVMGTPSPGSTQLGPQNVGAQKNPNLVPCSQWNTPAALSQSSADVNMHNTLSRR